MKNAHLSETSVSGVRTRTGVVQDLEKTQAQLEATRTRLQELKHVNIDHERTITRLERTASSSSIALEVMEDELTDKRHQVDAARKAFKDMTNRLQDESERSERFLAKTRAVRASLRRSKQANLRIENRNESANEHINQMENELTFASAEAERIEERYRLSLDALESKLAANKAELQQAHRQIEEHRLQLQFSRELHVNEANKLKHRIASLELAFERWRIEEEELIFENDELAKELEDSRNREKNLKG